MSIVLVGRILAGGVPYRTPTHKLMMLALADFADENGYSYPSVSRLQHRVGLRDDRGARRILRELEAAGYIATRTQAAVSPDGTPLPSNLYRILPPAYVGGEPYHKGWPSKPPGAQTRGGGSTDQGGEGLQTSLTISDPSQEPSKNHHPSVSPPGLSDEEQKDTRREDDDMGPIPPQHGEDEAMVSAGFVRRAMNKLLREYDEGASEEPGGTDTHDPPQTPLPGPQAVSTGPSDRELIELAARRKEEAKKKRAQGYKLRAVMDSATKKAIHEATPDAFPHVLLAAKLMGMSEEKLLEAYRKRPAFPPILNTLSKSEITSITSRAIDEATRHTEGWQQYPYAWFIQYVMEAGKQAATEQRTVWDAMKVLREDLVKSPDLKTSLAIIAQYQARGEYDGGHRTPEQFALMYASFPEEQ